MLGFLSTLLFLTAALLVAALLAGRSRTVFFLYLYTLFFEWVEEGRKIPIFGNGENRFQLLEVTDLASACYLAALKGRDKQVYNIGTTEFGTVKSTWELS